MMVIMMCFSVSDEFCDLLQNKYESLIGLMSQKDIKGKDENTER